MTVIAIYNIKGGVGKTATAVNLAYVSAQEGARTLLWDLDPQGAATFYFRARAKKKNPLERLVQEQRDPRKAIRGTDHEGLDVLPADFSARNLDLLMSGAKKADRGLKRLVKGLRDEYDRIFLDCAPGIGVGAEAVFRAADVLVVPAIPTTLSVNTLHQLERYFRTWDGKVPLVLPFFSMVDRRRAHHREILDDVGSMPFDFLNTVLPYAAQVEKMGTARAPVFLFAPRSKPADAYRELSREIAVHLDHRVD